MTREETLARVREKKLICIVRGLDPAPMKDLAQALLAGGIEMIEITFAQNRPETWKDTAAGIRMLNEEFAGKLIAGAGTVIAMEQLFMAYEAGARYIITPNMDPAIIGQTRKLGLVSMPGALTPT